MIFQEEQAFREVRAIEKLFDRVAHPNLVAVLSHGWVPHLRFYYIDMELCQGNLDNYIKNLHPYQYDMSGSRSLLGLGHERGIWNVWDIVEQITSGIQYIHSCKEVHRDIKPQNGLSFQCQRSRQSSFFLKLSQLEGW